MSSASTIHERFARCWSNALAWLRMTVVITLPLKISEPVIRTAKKIAT